MFTRILLSTIFSLSFSIASSFADGTTPYPRPNESGRSVFISVLDLFENAGIAVSMELSKLSDSVRSRADLAKYGKMSPLYTKKYWQDVEASANHFSIPETFLACLINKESSFESRVVSRKGAMGIMQFMRASIVEFNHQIRIDDYSKAAWGTFPFKDGKSPLRLSLMDVWNPEVMIPAGALRFKKRALLLFGEFGATNWTVPEALILVADYDMGPEALARICKFKAPKDLRDPPPLDAEAIDACMNELNPQLNEKAYPETWDEMRKVSDCMIGLPKAEQPKREPSTVNKARRPSAVMK